MKINIKPTDSIGIGLKDSSPINLKFGDRGGTNNYNSLVNKPRINHITIEDDHDGAYYKLQDKMAEITAQEIDKIIYGG